MTRQEAAAIARAAKASKAPALVERFWSKVKLAKKYECWNWTASCRKANEYGAFWLNGRHQNSNRVAWILSRGEIPIGLQVLHTCDNPKCCNPAHLFLGTNLENNQDKVNKKRHVFGSKVATSRLKAHQVIKIRELRKTKTAQEIAIIFGITKGYVGEICRRESWKHL